MSYYIIVKNYLDNTKNVSDFSLLESELDEYINYALLYYSCIYNQDLKLRKEDSNIIFSKTEVIVNQGYIYNTQTIKSHDVIKISFITIGADIPQNEPQIEEVPEHSQPIWVQSSHPQTIFMPSKDENLQELLTQELNKKFELHNYGLKSKTD